MNVETTMRERIIAAAAGLLVENGTHSSMSQIAQAAGVATGSIYNHFVNKDELLHAVYASLGEEMYSALVRTDPAACPERRFDDYIADYIDFIWRDANRAILFEYLSNVPLIPGQLMIEAFEGCSLYILDILTALVAEETVPDCDPAMMAAFVGGAIRNTLKWHRTTGRALTDADRVLIHAMCRRAIGLPPVAGEVAGG